MITLVTCLIATYYLVKHLAVYPDRPACEPGVAREKMLRLHFSDQDGVHS